MTQGESMSRDGGAESECLRAEVQRFVRGFGLLDEGRTPCGKRRPTPEAHALMALLDASRRGERLTHRELAALLRVDKSNVTRLCQRLVEAGELEQTPGAEDARTRRLALTPKGARAARGLERASAERFGRLFAAVPPDRRAPLLDAFRALNAALAEQNDEVEP
jgi:DNA-binding MarR family transcriptional regulator